MSGPPYHLRKNKAADRLTFLDAIGFLQKLDCALKDYTYYGFGGSYLEEMRLLYEYYPEIKLVSIEQDPNVYKRQDFHRPCNGSNLRLEFSDMDKFIAKGEFEDKQSIVWLDYTDLEYSCFEEFIAILQKVAPGSMVKITLSANPNKLFYFSKTSATLKKEKFKQFEAKYRNFLPSIEVSWKHDEFANYVQKMIQIAAQRAMSGSSYGFFPVSSFYYADGASMLTLTGVIWSREDEQKVIDAFKDWDFVNLSWGMPNWINIPDLTTKERLYLQRYLPCEARSGAALKEKLGYLLSDDDETTVDALEQYASYHRYYPYFLKGTP